MLFNIKLIIGAIILIIYSSMVGYAGYSIGSSRYHALTNEIAKQNVESVQDTLTATKENSKAAHKVAGAVAAEEAEQRVVYRTINKEVIRYVQTQPKDAAGNALCRLDAAGVLLDNQAAKATINTVTPTSLPNN